MSIRAGISRAGPGSCKPTPAPVLEPATPPAGPEAAFGDLYEAKRVRGRSLRPPAGLPAGANSPSWSLCEKHRGAVPEKRLAARQQRIKPLVDDLEAWIRLSRHAELAKAMDYMLKRWPAFGRFLGDGRICLNNNATGRALRGIALGRENWLFASSDRGGP